MGHFGFLGGTKNGTSGAWIKILRPLFNTNAPLNSQFELFWTPETWFLAILQFWVNFGHLHGQGIFFWAFLLVSTLHIGQLSNNYQRFSFTWVAISLLGRRFLLLCILIFRAVMKLTLMWTGVCWRQDILYRWPSYGGRGSYESTCIDSSFVKTFLSLITRSEMSLIGVKLKLSGMAISLGC